MRQAASSAASRRRAPCAPPPRKRRRAPPAVLVAAAVSAGVPGAGAATAPAAAAAALRTDHHPSYAIDVRGLRVRLGPAGADREVLRGVDLRVPRGHLHMLLGPNGCGKSTLLRALGGLLPPMAPPPTADTGAAGAAAAAAAPAAAAASSPGLAVDQPTGFVFQNPDHQVVMPTVAADVAFGLGRYNLPEPRVRAAVDAALALVNLGGFGQRPTHTLSGGQRQRVAIAGALAERPRVLLLDELTTFLDAEDQRGVLRAVRGVTRGGEGGGGGEGEGGASEDGGRGPAREGGGGGGGGGGVTAVWVTHRFEELEYADSVSYMDSGRVVFTGTAEEARRMLRGLGATL